MENGEVDRHPRHDSYADRAGRSVLLRSFLDLSFFRRQMLMHTHDTDATQLSSWVASA